MLALAASVATEFTEPLQLAKMTWISIWNLLFLCGGKKTVCGHFPLAVMLHIHSTRVFCVQLSRCRCVCLSVPSFLSAFSACSLALIFALPNYSPGNEGGLTELNLAVCQWLMACLLPGWSSVTVRKPVDLRSCLSVCLSAPPSIALPRPAQPSPASPHDCQTVCRPASDCCSVASCFVLAMLPLLSSRLSACPYCSFLPQLVSPSFVIFNWRTHPQPHKMNFPLFPFFESQGNSEIRKWFIGRQNFHRWMVILENSFPACRRLIAHLISRVFWGGNYISTGSRRKLEVSAEWKEMRFPCVMYCASCHYNVSISPRALIGRWSSAWNFHC